MLKPGFNMGMKPAFNMGYESFNNRFLVNVVCIKNKVTE